jgi:hypothetical protein
MPTVIRCSSRGTRLRVPDSLIEPRRPITCGHALRGCHPDLSAAALRVKPRRAAVACCLPRPRGGAGRGVAGAGAGWSAGREPASAWRIDARKSHSPCRHGRNQRHVVSVSDSMISKISANSCLTA